MPIVDTNKKYITPEGRFIPFHVRLENRRVKECVRVELKGGCQLCIYRSMCNIKQGGKDVDLPGNND